MQTVLLVERNATPFVSTQDAMAHARVTDPGEFGLIAAAVDCAVEVVEDYTGLALTQNTYRLYSYGWPRALVEAFPWYGRRPEIANRYPLMRSPLVSVESVKYYDEDGVQQTLDASNYVLDTVNQPGGLVFIPDFSFPALSETARADAVTIDFTAGGVTHARARQAVLILAKHFYDNPDAVGSTNRSLLPLAIQSLLLSLRV